MIEVAYDSLFDAPEGRPLEELVVAEQTLATARTKATASREYRRRNGLLEKLLESILVNAVRFLGGWSLKFVSPGTRGVPDRLCLLPVAPEHVEIIGRYVRFAEVKQKGKKPTVIQERVHQRLRALGYPVDIIDSCEIIETYYPKP